MGYTNYWRKSDDADEKQYASALKDIAKIVTTQKEVKLGNGTGDKGTKPKTTGGIEFNGFGEDGHETFSLPAKASQMQSFGFCKTNRKPYDLIVTAALSRLAEVKGIKISSDGTAEDFEDGAKLASKILGRKVENPLGSAAKKAPQGKPHLKLVTSFSTKIEAHYVSKKTIEFIADQIVNDEYSDDSEMADHLHTKTGIDKRTLTALIKEERNNFLRGKYGTPASRGTAEDVVTNFLMNIQGE